MIRQLTIVGLAFSTSLAVSCKKSDDKDETVAPASNLSGTLSLNLVPSLNAAAGVGTTSASLAPAGVAPDFETLQKDYLTPSSKSALFSSTTAKTQHCQSVTRTARALSKFLSNDSNLCIFKEVEKALTANESWISVTAGTVGAEGLFGQTSADKKLKFTASMGDGSMDIFFDIKGSAGSASANYELKMRQCQGTSLQSLQVVTIERKTGKVTIEQNGYEDGQSPKADTFTGYLNAAGDAWDLTKDRDFAYDMLRMDSPPSYYEAVSTKFTSAGNIVTTTIEGNASSSTTSFIAAAVVGSSANNLSLQEGYFRTLGTNGSEGGFEFVTSEYKDATAAAMKTIVEALPTTGRYVESQTSVALPLLEGLDCTMASPDISGTINLTVGEEKFGAACDSSLTDSSSETDANGNPVLRSGMYCSSL